MLTKGPHISVSEDVLVDRVFSFEPDELEAWPQAVRDIIRSLAAELFLVRYNPFIDPDLVRKSVEEQFRGHSVALSEKYKQVIRERIDRFWKEFDEDQLFKAELFRRLREFMPDTAVLNTRGSRVECATDATDLRMELPLAVLTPEDEAQIQGIVRLAGQMGFSIIPRGGGTGLTGGAIPSQRRSIILSLSKFKKILKVDPDEMVLCAQSGVLTLDAINAAKAKGVLFTVDPASKAASSLGGNISENSGGPFAFEYGTTIDNIHSFRLVRPDGEIVEVRRVNHPGHKILPEETAVFDVVAENGEVLETIELHGSSIRGAGLGKDVSNKALGGLPGVQKEGVDGVITECCFVLHPLPSLSRVLCLEFFGRSMHNAMLVIRDIVGYRDTIREAGDKVKISALEEFGPKYVQAIEYEKKSTLYEGDPISVLIVQLDSDDPQALDEAVQAILDTARPYENVDIFAARDEKEAEHFWEDRHKLSAIAKRTSGFKINEDIVIPLDVIPEFSDYLEQLNVHYLAKAYRTALREVERLPGMPEDEELLDQESDFAAEVLAGRIGTDQLTDQEFEVRIAYFFQEIESRHPKLKEDLRAVHDRLTATRVVIANHMHAGDGNCHVNFPVNSNDPVMLGQVHEAVDRVFKKVLSLGGAVSGEHGIGITKISFLEAEKIAALKEYKAKVDPRGIINPDKLTAPLVPVPPYTFSFNRLIQDLSATALPDKERLIDLLQNIQVCTRCGKCKQVCPMYFPERDLMYHPRNKNIALGALIEAIYYSLLHAGKPDKRLLDELRKVMEHCTACGRCFSVCPVKIQSSEVALNIRAFLEEKGSGGHPIKTKVLDYLAKRPERLTKATRYMSIGQKAQEQVSGMLGRLPRRWRSKLGALGEASPKLEEGGLYESIDLAGGSILVPESATHAREAPQTVFLFPGCGASLFYRSIGMAATSLLLRNDVAVVLPPEHLCCGYPLLSQGMEQAYLANYERNLAAVREVLQRARSKGFPVSAVLTSCGTCRESLHKYGLETIFGLSVQHMDVSQFLVEKLEGVRYGAETPALFHAACHTEWSGYKPTQTAEIYRKALVDLLGQEVRLSPRCCGESGLGALTSPEIYDKLRERKKNQLAEDLEGRDRAEPILVGCPSCKVGLKRSLMQMGQDRMVYHTLEYLARLDAGPGYKERLAQAVNKAAPQSGGVRFVETP